MALVKFTISVGTDGEATIRIPEGKDRARVADQAASLTKRIAEAMGTITERHVGRYEGGVHIHDDGTTHTHEGNH